MRENLEHIRFFRAKFTALEAVLPTLRATLPAFLTKLYSDCQVFAENEITSLLAAFERETDAPL
jgi:hypothetical protein